jgi:hypothetical protein
MTIAEYQTLTGTTVSDETRMKAVIRRAEAKLGSLLGYPLSKQKTWYELGKIQYDGLTPFPSLPVSDDVLSNLVAPDDQTGDYQLFGFDELDMHIKINPAKEIYRAKVVLPVNENEFITIYDLNNGTPYLNGAGLVTAVTRYYSWFTWTWWNSLLWTDRSHLMLAVDADYINACDIDKYPDLAYLLADMVTYYADPNYSLLGILKSETIDTHSYTRAATGQSLDATAPEGQPSAKMIIDRYAGPAAYRKKVR